MSTRLTCPIADRARQTPRDLALLCAERLLNYRQLDHRLNLSIAYLQQEGIAPGMRVGLWGPVGLEQVVVTAALWRAGVTVVPLNPRFPAAYVGEIAAKLAIDRFVAADRDIVARDRRIPVLTLPPGTAGDDEVHVPPAKIDIDPDYPATVILTSGSSGENKALCLSYANHHYNALGANHNLPLAPGDRWLLSLPLCHVGGLAILFRCFLAGAAVVVPPPNRPLGRIVADYGITHLSLVATQLQRLLEEPTTGPSRRYSLKAVLLGGGATPAPLLRRAAAADLPVHTTYGMSETASQVTTTAPGDPPARLSTAGRVLPFRSLKIDDRGEICVKGPILFKGYLEGQETVLPLDEDGWFKTGDLGSLDGDGYLTVRGRRDAMFISGGENIVPEEIEAALARCPGITRSLVVGVKDDVYGFRPAAFVKYADSCAPDRDTLLDCLQDKLPGFKIPDTFYDWPGHMEGRSLKVARPRFLELLERGGGVLLFKKHR